MRALFVGLCTLDVITRVDHVPAPNEKLTASAQLIAVSGPATNAAATFAHLGGEAVLLTAFGGHPLSAAIDEDLAALGVAVLNLTADSPVPCGRLHDPGHRVHGRPGRRLHERHRAAWNVPAVTPGRSPGARRLRRPRPGRRPPSGPGPPGGPVRPRRGHPHPARRRSWRPGTASLLPYIDIAVCSADFRPPGTSSPPTSWPSSAAAGVRWPIITRGPLPVLWQDGEVPVPALTTVADTLGAGDIFHGALAHALLAHVPTRLTPALLTTILRSAAETASRSCASFGTRAWMQA